MSAAAHHGESQALDAGGVALEIDLEPRRSAIHVGVRGELDLATVDGLRDVIGELTADGWGSVVVDLQRLTFIDSSGVRLLFDLERDSVQDRWQLGIIDGGPAVSRVFDLTGTREHLPFVGRNAPIDGSQNGTP